MPTVEIFRIHLATGLIAWGLYVGIFWYPKLIAGGRRHALRRIAMLHAFRFEGLLFLMPAFVGNGLPAAFAVPAAYGDFTTGMLAIASIVTFRWERVSLVLTVLYTIIGVADIVNNVYRVVALGIDHHTELLGVAYVIVVLYVPVLLITHGITAWLCLKPAEPVGGAVGVSNKREALASAVM
jgi:hypothetical protein